MQNDLHLQVKMMSPLNVTGFRPHFEDQKAEVLVTNRGCGEGGASERCPGRVSAGCDNGYLSPPCTRAAF